MRRSDILQVTDELLAAAHIAPARPKRLCERAHHHVHVSGIHPQQLADPFAPLPNGSDAVSLVQVQVRLRPDRPPTPTENDTQPSLGTNLAGEPAGHLASPVRGVASHPLSLLTLYFFFSSTISGSRHISPSMLYTPSTMITIFFHGRRVRG